MLQAWFGVGLGNTTECAICMAPFSDFVDEHPTWENYAKPDWLFVSKCCQNFFHRQCIDDMKSMGHWSCPVCRTPNVEEFTLDPLGLKTDDEYKNYLKTLQPEDITNYMKDFSVEDAQHTARAECILVLKGLTPDVKQLMPAETQDALDALSTDEVLHRYTNFYEDWERNYKILLRMPSWSYINDMYEILRFRETFMRNYPEYAIVQRAVPM
tara:strand:- start:140 stop:775 length:636 start_codon:yes stop_codon:yes gene_type:complete